VTSAHSSLMLSSFLSFFDGEEEDSSNRVLFILTTWDCFDRLWFCWEFLSQLDRSRGVEPDVERYWRLLSTLPSEVRREWSSSLRRTVRWEMWPLLLCAFLLKLPRNRSRLPLEIIDPRIELLFMLLLRLCFFGGRSKSWFYHWDYFTRRSFNIHLRDWLRSFKYSLSSLFRFIDKLIIFLAFI